MRNINNLIKSLSKEEKRSFQLFLNRNQKHGSSKRVQELFNLANRSSNSSDEFLQQKLYPSGKKGAYYVLKNKLIENLEKSLFLSHISYSDRIKLIYQVGVAKIYINKLLFKEAYVLLKKVEKQARKEGYFDLLLIVYFEITGIAMEYQEVDLGHYLNKQVEALEQYKDILQLDQLLKHIAYKLIKSNYAIKDLQLNDTLEEIQQKLQLNPKLLQSAKIQFEIHNCIKRTLLQNQNFEELESYLISSFHEFEERQLFNKDALAYKIVHQVWIINCMFKNFKFAATASYIDQLHQSLLSNNKNNYNQYIWTYYQCQYTHYFYSNQLKEAIQLLTKIEDEKHHKGLPFYDVFVQLNLTTIHYCNGQLSLAMKRLALLFIKDTYASLSIEIKFRLALVEIILHFDNEDYDFLEYRIREIKKSFRKLLQQSDYQREKEFIKIIWKCLNLAVPFEQKKIIELCTTFVSASPSFEPGSNEAINYQFWIQSKLEKKDYYQLVLQQALGGTSLVR